MRGCWGDLPIARCRKYSFGFKFSWPLCSRLGDGTDRNDAHVSVNNNNGDEQSSLPLTGTSVLDAPLGPNNCRGEGQDAEHLTPVPR